MNHENTSDRPSSDQNSGLPWQISEPEEQVESGVHHLGFIDKFDPIPTLRKLLARLYPYRRSFDD
ncbi:MAG TPA: hypothetical protein VKT25_14105 [Ktedonobacteraceae bacterium]|nr:hypothetical protein [Ktedonobacteraceae bacterium]